MLPAIDRDALLREVIETPRRAYLPLPDLEVIAGAGWHQIITPSFRTGGFNEIAWSVLDPADADAVIERAIAQYQARGIAFRWTVGPDSHPGDLADRLARRGLVPTSVLGMARATTPGVDRAPELEIELVTPARADVYTRVMAEGWGVDPAPLARANELALAAADAAHRLFLGYVDGVPAGTASYVAFPRSAYLLGAVVLPAFRQRGLYQALVAARLADAAHRGIELATCRAREQTSAPILARLGFATVCRFTSFAG